MLLLTLLLSSAITWSPFSLELRTIGAGHRVSLEQSYLRIDTELLWDELHQDATLAPLAVALPANATFDSATLRPQRDRLGRIVALHLTDPGAVVSRVTVRVPRPEGEGPMTLPLPMPRGPGVHRVAFSRELSFVPDPTLGLVSRLGYLARPDLDRARRRRLDVDLDGARFRRPLGAIYVRSEDEEVVTRGLHGRLEVGGARSLGWALLAAFLVVAGALVAAYRRLGPRAEAERAERALADEFARL